YALSMANSKRGGSSAIAMLEPASRSVPPNVNGALAKADTMITIAARNFIEPLTIKRAASFAIRALLRRSPAAAVHWASKESLKSEAVSEPEFGNERSKSGRGRRRRLSYSQSAHVLRQRTRPITLVVDAQARCVQGVSFQQQSQSYIIGPASFA